MKSHAKVVIIGAGIVGASAAYHLAELGWRDIVVVDQGPLSKPGGSTSHAPGGMFQTNPARFMCEAAQYTVQFYDGLHYGGEKCAQLAGSLELAQTPARLKELHRRCAIGRAFGLQGEVITPKECGDMLPHLDSAKVTGGYFVPDDATCHSNECNLAIMEKAKETGAAEFFGDTTVIGIATKENSRGEKRVASVITDKGEIKTEMALCCAGFWGPKIGRMVGQPIPLMPMSHLYAMSRPIDSLSSLAKERGEVVLPLTRAQDNDLYFRSYFSQWGVGTYGHEPMPIWADEILPPQKAKVMPSLLEWRGDLYNESWNLARKLFPDIGNVEESTDRINGVFSFTVDGQSILGESLIARGFWVAEAIWFTHGGGVGKLIAEWMHEDEPPCDCHLADVNRFYPHATSPEFILQRGVRTYIEVYDILHPKDPSSVCRNLRRSPMDSRHREKGGYMMEVGGFERPQWFHSNEELLNEFTPPPPRDEWSARHWSPIESAEAQATRKYAGIYDLSAFALFEVAGSGALNFLQHLSANNLDVPPGRVVYTNLTSNAGGIACDLTIMRMEKNRFYVVTGGGSAPQDFAWLIKNHPGDDSVHLSDIGGNFAAIGLWGPKAAEIMSSLCGDDLSAESLKYFHWKHIFVGAIPVVAVRLSYIGEFGWEFYTSSEYGLALWDSLTEAGQKHKLAACGFGGFNELRMEKGMRSWGTELDIDRNPLEAGLSFAVKFDKGEFKGRDALLKIKKEGIHRRLCTVVLNQNQALLGGEAVYADGKVRGYITSADYSPSAKKTVGFVYLPTEIAKEETPLQVDYLGERFDAQVVRDILFDPQGLRLRGKY